MLTGDVKISRPFFARAIGWCLGYLWSAVAALAICYAADWQYDGDLGWWVVTIYSFPALTLASPLISLAGFDHPNLAAIYCLLALAALSIAGLLLAKHRTLDRHLSPP